MVMEMNQNPMNNLKFGNNWRRELLLTHTASVVDLDVICSYVLLDEKKLGTDIKSFCSNHWDEHGFDYDVTSYEHQIWIF